MKRLLAPGFWEIKRKEKKFTVTPSPGPHSSGACIPIAVVLRDILKTAEDMSEVKQIIAAGSVKVNGKIRRDKKFPVGLMDVLEVGEKYYRVLVGNKGLKLYEIKKKDAVPLMQIKNKTYVKKNKKGLCLQFNMHDGTNMLIDNSKDYSTGDVLVLKDGKISDVLPFAKDSLGIITKGNNIGAVGTVENIIVKQASLKNEVILNVNGKSEKILVPKNYVFIIGKSKTDAKGVKTLEPVIDVAGGKND
ncbi:MAG: 30S ribosomal protein S4e [Candidatus Aenigmarchaeota archaeon]|nr:30S ribosomal protein S4e [Candidatus Aenigmarchaeota archaeon]